MGKPGGGNAPSPTPEHIGCEEGTQGNDTSEYLEEKKETRSIPLVVASEGGNSPNPPRESLWALRGGGCRAGRGRATARPKELQTMRVAEPGWKARP